jgi:Cu/Ag efflux pump CusA
LGFNLQPDVALGQAVEAISAAALDIGMPGSIIGTFQGNAQAFQNSLSTTPVLVCAALIVVYIILGILYESFIHPLTILSTLPSAGVGAPLALCEGSHGPVGHRTGTSSGCMRSASAEHLRYSLGSRPGILKASASGHPQS